MEILADLTLCELENLMLEMGEPKFRAKQIFTSISQGNSISQTSNISKELKVKLLNRFCDSPVKIIKTLVSVDGTQKYLLELHDGNIVEGVYMKNNYGNTQCLSTQVGCRMGCKFCASTIGGLVRNLTAGEMLYSVALLNKVNGGNLKNRATTNIVLMGSGEPFDNYDNVVKFLKLVSFKDGLNVSLRNISLSTCGLVKEIYKFAEENLPANLTISLHQPFDDKREKLMPISKAYKINDILKACDYYFSKTGRRFIFEYTLVKGENDGIDCIDELTKLLKSRPCHINVIRLNEVKESGLKGTDEKQAYKFVNALTERGLSATVRRLNGADIEGACGQLRRSYIEK